VVLVVLVLVELLELDEEDGAESHCGNPAASSKVSAESVSSS
jgi:hypothetical protein